MLEVLRINLCSPLSLAFVAGADAAEIAAHYGPVNGQGHCGVDSAAFLQSWCTTNICSGSAWPKRFILTRKAEPDEE